MPKECGVPGDEGVLLPAPLNLTSERLDRHGLYLIEDGQNMFLWVGRAAVPALVNDAFGLGSYEEVRAGKVRQHPVWLGSEIRLIQLLYRLRYLCSKTRLTSA
jgi:hypothetical protein